MRAADQPSSCARTIPWGWVAVAILVIANVPLMLCMPLPADAALYDLQAKTALTGGLLYRDIVEPNLPGIVWCHMAIRSALGWSEAALKWVDLVVVAGILSLLLKLLGRMTTSQSAMAGFAFVAVGFYCSTPEWVHCQRDIWLMLPALAAFTLRVRRMASIRPSTGGAFREGEAPLSRDRKETCHDNPIESGPCPNTRQFPGTNAGGSLDHEEQPFAGCGSAGASPSRGAMNFGSSVLEGLLWACAFWIKPYVAVPAVAAIVMSIVIGRPRTVGGIVRDVGGVLLGGAIVGAAGIAWLIGTGVWPHFVGQMTVWNPIYFANGRSRWTLDQYVSLSRDLAPWCFVHLAAVPVAVAVLWQAVKEARLFPLPVKGDSRVEHSSIPKSRASVTLLAALYLGWMFQAHFLQHPFHYCHTPTVILAAALLAAVWPSTMPQRRLANYAFACGLAVAMLIAPCFDPSRLAWWPDCISRGAQPDVKCALHHRNLPNWIELQPVIDYLKRQNLKDGELTAYNVFLVHLYPAVGVRPSTRYVFLDVLMQVFHQQAADIRDALARSPQRFVVCSLLENGMSPADIAADGPGIHTTLPATFPQEHAGEFPYCLPIVFRSGQYVVYRVDQRLGELNTTPRPLAVK